jgi:hypothetical protein
MSPRFVRPYVKSNKNDARDAEAICEAVGRPSMRFVAVKSQAQQDMLALHRVRSLLVRGWTQAGANTTRSFAPPACETSALRYLRVTSGGEAQRNREPFQVGEIGCGPRFSSRFPPGVGSRLRTALPKEADRLDCRSILRLRAAVARR